MALCKILAYRALAWVGAVAGMGGAGVLENSVFFPTPIVCATKSRTDRSSESQPDGTLRKGNTIT